MTSDEHASYPPALLTPSEPSAPTKFTIPHLRWYICALLFAACTINYIDRQTVAVLKTHLQTLMHWSETDYSWMVFLFQLSYAIMMVVSGKVIDWLGTRAGFAIAMVWWSLAAMAHAFCRTVTQFEIARFFLGAGEAANFPACVKSVAEWFPRRERALATGIFNSGTNVAALVGTPLATWLTLKWGWGAAFIFTGALGFVWLVGWLALYRTPEKHPWLTSAELRHISERERGNSDLDQPATPWQKILRHREAWGFIIGKFLTDPIWWFYIFWLPSYLGQARGFSLREIGMLAWIPPFAASFGGIAGGWLSGFWLRRGWTLTRARKVTMLVMAALMPAGIVAVLSPRVAVALALIAVAMAAHQGWSANIFTLASDMFPKKDVGSLVGLGGAAGAVGGMIIAPVAGYTLKWLHTYIPLFVIAGVMHPLAMSVVHWLIPKVQQVQISEASQ